MTAAPDLRPATRVAREAMAARSRGRRANGASLGQRLNALYTALLAVAILGSMTISGTASVLHGGSCSTAGRCLDPAGRPALSAAVALVGSGLLLWAGAVLGPVACTGAEATWLLSTPADRRTLLLPSLARALTTAAVAGGVLGWLALTATEAHGIPPADWPAAILTGAALAVAAVGAIAASQAGDAGRSRWSVAGWALVSAGAVCAAAALAPVALPHVAQVPAVATVVLPVAAVVLAVGAGLLSARTAGAVPLRELRAAGNVRRACRAR